MRFEALLEEIETLPEERQETLLELVRRRLAEKRRREIARHAQEARELSAQDQLPRGRVEDLRRDLEEAR